MSSLPHQNFYGQDMGYMMLRRQENIYQQDRVLLPYDQYNNNQQDIGYMMLRRQQNMCQQDMYCML